MSRKFIERLVAILLILASPKENSAQDGFWQQIYSFSIPIAIYSIDTNSKGHLFIAAGDGIFRSFDDGQTWDKLHSLYSRDLVIDDNDFIIAASGDDIHLSKDNGDSWQRIFEGDIVTKLAVNSHNHIIAGASEDLGNDSSPGLFCSKDSGTSWSEILGLSDIAALTVNPQNDYIYTAPHHDIVIWSEDSGQTWMYQDLSEHDAGVQSIHSLFVKTNGHVFVGGSHGVSRSTDGCYTWAKVLSSSNIWSLFITVDGTIFAGGDDVLLSTDGGDSWIKKTPLTDRRIYTAFTILRNNYIIVCSGQEIFQSVSPVSGIKHSNNSAITSFQLKQNYPNPFNATTTIIYDLPKSGNVTLIVYNLLGQNIETLVNGFQTVGEHQVEWNAEGLPSGIYLYKLEAGESFKIKKFILQK